MKQNQNHPKFLLSETDINIKVHNLVYYYSSNRVNDPLDQMIFPLLPDYTLCIDVEYFAKLAVEYEIQEVPSLVILDKGKVQSLLTGPKIIEFLEL